MNDESFTERLVFVLREKGKVVKMKGKKILNIVLTAAILLSSIPAVMASEITEPLDPGYQGETWQSIEDGREFGHNDHDTGSTIELSTNPDYTSDGNGSVKIT